MTRDSLEIRGISSVDRSTIDRTLRALGGSSCRIKLLSRAEARECIVGELQRRCTRFTCWTRVATRRVAIRANAPMHRGRTNARLVDESRLRRPRELRFQCILNPRFGHLPRLADLPELSLSLSLSVSKTRGIDREITERRDCRV